MIKVLLVDDENLLLDSLEVILTINKMDVVGKANDGNEALKLIPGILPDIALVDLNMKGMGGIELIGIMREKYPQIKVMVLTTFYDDEFITKAISAGAHSYLLKDSGKDKIIDAINYTLNGITIIDNKVMTRLQTLINSPKQIENKTLSDLSYREKEIAHLMVEGLTNKQIADRLYISEGTVKNYISNIYDKTGIHDRVKLIVELQK